jgi:hypothetical protein
MLEFDPSNNRIGFFHNDKKIEIDESYYFPTFIANDIEELR